MKENENDIANKFCLVVGIDAANNIFIETLLDCENPNISDTADLLYLMTTGALNTEIKSHLGKHCKDPSISNNVLKAWARLIKANNDKPLIDPLQVMTSE